MESKSLVILNRAEGLFFDIMRNSHYFHFATLYTGGGEVKSRRDGSNERSQHMFWFRNKKIIFELSSIPPLIWSAEYLQQKVIKVVKLLPFGKMPIIHEGSLW